MEILLSFIIGLFLGGIGVFFKIRSVKASATTEHVEKEDQKYPTFITSYPKKDTPPGFERYIKEVLYWVHINTKETIQNLGNLSVDWDVHANE